MFETKNKPAFPTNESPGVYAASFGVTRLEYIAAKFTAAWIPVIANRNGEFSDTDAGVEATRLGLQQAEEFLERTEIRP